MSYQVWRISSWSEETSFGIKKGRTLRKDEMGADILANMLVVLFGGLMVGSFTLPQKYMRGWRWETSWTVYSVVGFLFIPWAVAAVSVPDLFDVYRGVDPKAILWTLLFGFGWGIANVCFGIAVQWIGMAISFAI